MPLYEYECGACGRRFELIRRHSDQNLDRCPHCQGGPVVRLQSAPAFQFKGSGWYITDYARQNANKASEKSPDAASGESSAPKPETGTAAPDKSTAPAPAASSTSSGPPASKD